MHKTDLTPKQSTTPVPAEQGNVEEPSSTETRENSDFPSIELPGLGDFIENIEEDKQKK